MCCLVGCDLVLGLPDYKTAGAVDAGTELEEPDSGFRPQTFTIGMVSAPEDRVAQRQHGASMAVEVINQAGGIPDGTGRKRTLTLRTATGPSAASGLRELKSRAKLSAVIGPDSSDAMLELLTAADDAQLFMIGPNNTVDSIVEAQDSWSLVPTDHQRMPLLMRALADLEAELEQTRGGRRALRLSVVYRDDAFGRGWLAAIERASWGGVELLHADNQARVSIEAYDPKAQAQHELIGRLVAFAPDVMITIGMSEVVTQVMAPLESMWQAEQRPEYLLTDAAKGAELLQLISERTPLMPRVHGLGATAIPAAEPSHQQFLNAYGQRFSNGAPAPVGVEAATGYDAVFVIAYALAASTPGTGPGSGPAIAQSLARLTGGALVVEAHEPQLAAALSALSRGESISARGTLSAFEWDSGGGIASGAAELWCVVDAMSPRYASAGLTFDIAARSFGSQPSECELSLPGQTTSARPEATTPISAQEADAGITDTSQDAAPILPPYDLSVQYQANDAVANDNSIRPFVRVLNAADGESVSLRELSLRYYIDNEHAERCPEGCVSEISYAGTQPSGRAVRAQSRFVATSGTLGYLEVTFSGAGQGALAADESLDVQL
ncbi:MAG TPA: ABC transporter substrate-binding protein, partial [Polyangiales bacterium]|nr:ABC transporter substrate-binding protein [Polyangiales bacterium]